MRKLFYILFSCISLLSLGQEEKQRLREGNKEYKDGNYTAAEKSYQKSLEKKSDYYKGSFNLGDAYYKQGKYQEAANQFELLTTRKTSKDTLAKAYHNLGNALLKSKKFEESVNAYKNALKNNPEDEDTRYNLAYAQKMLQQQQQQQKQDKDKKDNKDNKDNKDKKDDKKKEDKKDQNKQDKKDQQQQQQQQKNQISKEDAQRLLDAMNNQEKETQDKLKKKKTAQGTQGQIEKDW